MKKIILLLTAVWLCFAVAGTAQAVAFPVPVAFIDPMHNTPPVFVSVEQGQPVTPPNMPSYPGIFFTGWVDANSGIPWDLAAPVMAPMTLVATWLALPPSLLPVHLVTNIPGNSAITIPVPSGVPLPPGVLELTYPHHTLRGWYTTPTFEAGSVWSASRPVSQETTLYAQWESEHFPITYKDGESVIATAMADYGSKLTAPTPEKEGHRLTGWTFTSATATGTWNFNDRTVESTTTLRAQWYANNYPYSFNPGNGGEGFIAPQKFGTFLSKPTTPTREGYNFVGWYTDSEGINAWDYDTMTMPAHELEVWGIWAGRSQTLTLDKNDGSTPTTSTITYGRKIAEPTEPTRDGWVFDDWYSDPDFQHPWYFDADTVKGDVHLYAHWVQPPTFVSPKGCTFDKQSSADATCSVRGAQEELTGVKLEGKSLVEGTDFSFNGEECTFHNSFLKTLSVGRHTVIFEIGDGELTNPFVITVTDSAPTYKITVGSLSGGTIKPSLSTAQSGTHVTLTIKPQEGYRFISARVNGKPISGAAFTMPNKNAVITATFEKIRLTMHVLVSSSRAGRVVGSRTIDWNGALVLRAAPKAGYHFVKWTENGRRISSSKVLRRAHIKGAHTYKAVFVQDSVFFWLKRVPGHRIEVRWHKRPGAAGYQIMSKKSVGSKFRVRYTGVNQTRLYTSLWKKPDTTYLYKMRYFKWSHGKRIWSVWTPVKAIR